MNEQLQRIKNKLLQLKKLDKCKTVFGSENHHYRLNPIVSEEEIKYFESTHAIELPTEYVGFLTQLSNGGAGPFYGLEPIENALYTDLDYKPTDVFLNPSKPFLYTEPWNLEFIPSVDEEVDSVEYNRQLEKFDEDYMSIEHKRGVVVICNYGCGITMNLVVNGDEVGNIWTDDRVNDMGVHPSFELGNKEKISFLNWYELWLDNSLKDFDSSKITAVVHVRPWWKFW